MAESFVHLGMGKRWSSYLGLAQTEPKYGRDYVSVELGLKGIVVDGKMSTKKEVVEPGQFVQLVAEGTLNPNKCRAVIVPNQKLAIAGVLSYQPIVEGGDSTEIVLSFDCKQKINVRELSWLVRLYALV